MIIAIYLEKAHFKNKMEVRDSAVDNDDTEMGEAEPIPQKINKKVTSLAVKGFVQKLREAPDKLTKTMKRGSYCTHLSCSWAGQSDRD